MSLRYHSNLSVVAGKYLAAMGVPFTRKRVTQLLEEHPFYPSLFSLKHLFDQYHIENEAFRVTRENFDEFVPPYIAYYNHKDKGADFVLVTHNTKGRIGFTAAGSKTIWVAREVFFDGFHDVVFAAESNAESREPGFEERRNTERKAGRGRVFHYAVAALAIVFIFARFFSGLTTELSAAIPLAVTKTAGIIITLLLLVYETDHSNSLVKNLCTAGKQFNCDAVLNSAGGRIWGISWGDAGFFYFAATLLFLLVPGTSFPDKLPWLAIGATMVAPPTWCTACITSGGWYGNGVPCALLFRRYWWPKRLGPLCISGFPAFTGKPP